jgi:hypothetical protein
MDGMKGCGSCHRAGYDGRCDSPPATSSPPRPADPGLLHLPHGRPPPVEMAHNKHGAIYVDRAQDQLNAPQTGREATAIPTLPRPPAPSPHARGNHGVKTSWGFGRALPEDDMDGGPGGDPGARVLDNKAPTRAGCRRPAARLQRKGNPAAIRCSGSAASAMPHPLPKKSSENNIRASDKLWLPPSRRLRATKRQRPSRQRTASTWISCASRREHPIEQKLYVMLMEHRARAFQGAFT